MVQIEDLIDIAVEKNASDIHLMAGIKPMLRIIRKLEPIEKYEVMTEDDMYEVYDSLIRGNLDKDNIFLGNGSDEVLAFSFMTFFSKNIFLSKLS